jgi:acetylornithine deacetylase
MTGNAGDDAAAILTLLERLVGFDTTSRNSNLDLIEFAETWLAGQGARCRRVPNADGSKANLLASFGPLDRPGAILSGHTDVVPVDDQAWASDPFHLTVRDGRAYGRGTADMKGFVAVCLSLAPELAATPPDRPVHFAFSYDEELGCLGAPDLARTLHETFGPQEIAIVGEPTNMHPVIGHKANAGLEIVVRGRAAHSSLAPTTVNAVEVAGRFIAEVRALAEEAAAAAADPLYDVPVSTICVTRIDGGTAINIVPAECRLTVEFRLLPALDRFRYRRRLQALADALLPDLRRLAPEADIGFRELFAYPGLETAADLPAVTRVKQAAGTNGVSKVAYGTEAGIFSALTRTPTVIIGPGSIGEAHKPDEFVAVKELADSAAFLRRLLR